MDTNTGIDRESRDPRQLYPPIADTSIRLGPLKMKSEWPLFAPAIGGAAVGLTAPLMGNGLFLPGITTAVGGAAFGALAKLSTPDRITPAENIENGAKAMRRRMSMPWGRYESLEQHVHGVRRVFDDGMVEMDDGRVCMLVRIDGVNADNRESGSVDDLCKDLTAVIDECIEDVKWRFYSTTFEYDPEELAARYDERAESEALEGVDGAYARELMYDIAEYYRNEESASWDSRYWANYITLEIRPGDSLLFEDAADPKQTWKDRVDPRRGDREYNDSSGIPEDTRRAMQRDLYEAVDDTLDGVRSYLGVDAEKVGPSEALLLLARHWTGEDWAREDIDASTAAFSGGYAKDSATARGVDPITPTKFEDKDGYLQVGSQYVRSYYIFDYPEDAESSYLEKLYTRGGIDAEVCFHADPVDVDIAKNEALKRIATVGADVDKIAEEESEIKAESLSVDERKWIELYSALDGTETQSWRLTGYITVRAGDREALRELEDEFAQLESVDAAKYEALDERADELFKDLRKSPANLFCISTPNRQLDLFRSCSPVGTDAYRHTSREEKSRLVSSSAYGALLPNCSVVMCEDVDEVANPIDFGRNAHNGSPIRASPFERGKAPHMLFIAESGWGKSYFLSRCLQRWQALEDDGQLILCDTMGAFENLVETLPNAKHIPVGGSVTLNPLEFHRAPQHVLDRAEEKIDPFGMKVESVVAFFVQILRAQRVEDVGQYTDTLQMVVEEAYGRFGIESDPSTHPLSAKNCPTVATMFEVMNDMDENPAEYISSSAPSEHAKAEKRAKATALRDRLECFRTGEESDSDLSPGKYAHLNGHTDEDARISDGDVVYIDMQQIEGGDVETAAMLWLIFDQVGEGVKRHFGRTVAFFDEAHYLLHSDEMTQWLQKNARHWRHYDASLCMSSQSPREFVDTGSNSATNRATIVDQMSVIGFGRTPITDKEIDGTELLQRFPGVEESDALFIQNEATRGSDGRGYSELALKFADRDSWLRCEVDSSPFEDITLRHDRDEGHPSYPEYIREQWGRIQGAD